MKLANLVRTIAVAALIASGSGAVLATQHGGHGGQSTPPGAQGSSPATRTGKARGRIVEVDRNSITVETQNKGKTERIVCLIDGKTKLKGELAAGVEVAVNFREESGAKIATKIEVKKEK